MTKELMVVRERDDSEQDRQSCDLMGTVGSDLSFMFTGQEF